MAGQDLHVTHRLAMSQTHTLTRDNLQTAYIPWLYEPPHARGDCWDLANGEQEMLEDDACRPTTQDVAA